MNFIPLKDENLFLNNTFDKANFPSQAYLTTHLFKISVFRQRYHRFRAPYRAQPSVPNYQSVKMLSYNNIGEYRAVRLYKM